MGCTGSKQAQKTLHGHNNPYIRSQSLPVNLINYKEAPHELSTSVTLTSSTIGSLSLDPKPGFSFGEEMMKSSDDKNEANSWSEMIDKHCKWAPLTPTKTPLHEPEIINVWELMEGLEETSPIHKLHDRSFSFHTSNRRDESVLSKLDPDIVYAFLNKREIPKFNGLVKARVNAFQEKIDARKSKIKCPPGGEKKVTFYFTSLRGIRKTFEDCSDTKIILQSYGVVIDERDVSMHGKYKEELKEIMGEKFDGKLPQVFADGRHIGGAEEVMKLHEGGELGEKFGRCESARVKKVEGADVACGQCGNMRFVPCETCSGSCKVFVCEEEEEEEETNRGFRRCVDCNENGLIRCPICC